MTKRTFTAGEARQIGDEIGINWSRFSVEQFRQGLEIESEHGLHDQKTNVTNDSPIITGKIAWAHLKEYPDYYERHAKMEKEAEGYWRKMKASEQK